MKRFIFPMLLAAAVLAGRELSPMAQKLQTARTAQIDPGFSYYQDRSVESIASELKVNGYGGVWCYLMVNSSLTPGLVDALHRQGLPVGLMTLPSLVYPSFKEMDAFLPPGYRDYLMVFTGNDMKEYRFIGFIHPGYNRWYKRYLCAVLTSEAFDGFTFAEVMYPILDGPERNPPFYGDVSKTFQAAFCRSTGEKAFPDFFNRDSPHYFRKNKELYRKLVDFRVKIVNDFYDDIVNSADGVRAARPEILFATWTLGLNIPGGVEKLREWEGNDIALMISQVKPDVHFIQTHYPDWIRADLKPDYVLGYKPFFDRIRSASAGVKIGMQADFGSYPSSRKDTAWKKEFLELARQAGVQTTTFYEFSLRREVYEGAPELRAHAWKGKVLTLQFSKRLDAASASVMTGRTCGKAKITAARIDGNLLICDFDTLPGSAAAEIDLGGIRDDVAHRFPRTHIPPEPRGPQNSIPDGTLVKVPQ